MELKDLLRLSIFISLNQLVQSNDNTEEWLLKHYDTEKIDEDFLPLLEEFLQPYALNKAEKSE